MFGGIRTGILIIHSNCQTQRINRCATVCPAQISPPSAGINPSIPLADRGERKVDFFRPVNICDFRQRGMVDVLYGTAQAVPGFEFD